MSTHKHNLKLVKSIVFGRMFKFKCRTCGKIFHYWRTDVNSMVKGKVLHD